MKFYTKRGGSLAAAPFGVNLGMYHSPYAQCKYFMKLEVVQFCTDFMHKTFPVIVT